MRIPVEEVRELSRTDIWELRSLWVPQGKTKVTLPFEEMVLLLWLVPGDCLPLPRLPGKLLGSSDFLANEVSTALPFPSLPFPSPNALHQRTLWDLPLSALKAAVYLRIKERGGEQL